MIRNFAYQQNPSTKGDGFFVYVQSVKLVCKRRTENKKYKTRSGLGFVVKPYPNRSAKLIFPTHKKNQLPDFFFFLTHINKSRETNPIFTT